MAILTDVPHFAIPFRFVSSGETVVAAVNEQGSLDDVFDCVQVIARYSKGEMIEDLNFGVTDQLFAQGQVDADLLRSEITDIDPRASVAIAQSPDRFDSLIDRVTADVSRQE